jgi:ceramide glucosyltransferase
VSLLGVALGGVFAVLAAAGVIYSVMTAVFVRRFFRNAIPAAETGLAGSVSVLKPLHGAEPGLLESLATVFAQTVAQPMNIVLGLQDSADPARPITEALIFDHPRVRARLSLGKADGSNRKIGNLIQMSADGLGDIVVLSDSDIGMPDGHLARVLAALARPGVGLVTCPYYGIGATGFWSRLAGMGVSYHFLPNLITGVSLGLAHPCMGSTIALRRDTLDRIGGFAAFRDVLADDYAMGAAVRGLGLKSLVAPLLVSHTSSEASLAEVYSHELRWGRTVKGVDPAGYAGSLVTYPVPLALIAVLFLGGSPVSLAILVAALAARHSVKMSVDEAIGVRLNPWWLLPMRDIVLFAVFVGSFLGRTVVWRGETLRVAPDGRLTRV